MFLIFSNNTYFWFLFPFRWTAQYPSTRDRHRGTLFQSKRTQKIPNHIQTIEILQNSHKFTFNDVFTAFRHNLDPHWRDHRELVGEDLGYIISVVVPLKQPQNHRPSSIHLFLFLFFPRLVLVSVWFLSMSGFSPVFLGFSVGKTWVLPE